PPAPLLLNDILPIESPVVDERPRGREVFLKPPQSPSLRRRCKSLPTPTERAKLEISRSRSPTSEKKVRFADSLGLELISVKHFSDADEPEVPEPPTQSVEVKVLLESVEADEFSLSGFVRVLNLAFEKSVSLRYSLNNWITFMDSLALYVPDSSDGVTDKFCFKIIMPTYLDNGGTLQFAIKYCVGGEEYWDNNNGNNYKASLQDYCSSLSAFFPLITFSSHSTVMPNSCIPNITQEHTLISLKCSYFFQEKKMERKAHFYEY
uniref:CBM21 domain-containing protein n=1 Tax=Sphaeramia orbicularis TaxID=375764 RepID=A0A673A0Z6_9TELE